MVSIPLQRENQESEETSAQNPTYNKIGAADPANKHSDCKCSMLMAVTIDVC